MIKLLVNVFSISKAATAKSKNLKSCNLEIYPGSVFIVPSLSRKMQSYFYELMLFDKKNLIFSAASMVGFLVMW